MRVAFVVGLAVVVLTGCSLMSSQQEDPVQVKLRELDGRVARIERVVSNQSLVDLAQRVDTIEAELRAIHGQIEELQNANETLRKQQRDLYGDLEKRLTAVGSAGGANAGGVAPGGEAAAGSGAGGAAAGGEQGAYTQAFDALKASNYPAAIAGFRAFLGNYPSSELADNAEYWLGEAYYVTRDYDQAAEAFRTVGQRWPQSRKAADALLKLGFSQYELKRYSEARDTLSQVQQRFPESPAAKLAADRLAKIPAGAH